MSQIEVQNLNKTFVVPVKVKGNSFLKRIFQPEHKEVVAVDKVSFSVEKGETVAFIGPNGAGKSTTIKMLTGILFPTSGKINILGYIPWKDRQNLAYKIGTVFGQKNQLSYHLPASDSFRLFARIYELDDKVYEKRLSELTALLDVSSFINQPLRKLSLGQRMRCEIIASLLHNPEIIFLDEPTIGLDVVAKRELRDVLRNLNKHFNTTIFLTSHDTGDIEALCERTIIINHGKIIFDDKTDKLKQNYIKVKRLYVSFEEPISDFTMEDVKVLKSTQTELSLEVNTEKRIIRSVLEELIKKYTIVDINVEDPSLEEIISGIYQV